MEGITRREVAKKLGVSLATVRRMERGQLHPAIGLDGVRRFDPAEVEAVAKMRAQAVPVSAATAPTVRLASVGSQSPAAALTPIDGELAANVFCGLDGGKTPAAIVVGMRVSPDIVRRLHQDWLDFRALDVTAPTGTQRLAALETRLAEAQAYAEKIVVALNALTARVLSLPVEPITAITCEGCGTTGSMTVPVACAACGLRAARGGGGGGG